MLHPEGIQAVCQQVYARFPNLHGVQPSVQRQGLANSAEPETARYLLVFKTQSVAVDGRKMQFLVRVVADHQGNILKLTTSR